MDAYYEDVWFDFSVEPIIPWWEVALPVNMLLSVVALTGLLCILIRRNEQSEEDEEIQAYESIRKVKWHLEEEILEEAKKFIRSEEIRCASTQRRSSMKSYSCRQHDDGRSAIKIEALSLGKLSTRKKSLMSKRAIREKEDYDGYAWYCDTGSNEKASTSKERITEKETQKHEVNEVVKI